MKEFAVALEFAVTPNSFNERVRSCPSKSQKFNLNVSTIAVVSAIKILSMKRFDFAVIPSIKILSMKRFDFAVIPAIS